MMGILILLLAVITVAITLILVSRLSKTAGKDQKEETFDRSVSGMLSNAYILKSEEKDIIVLYRGETYFAEGKPEKKYTGVADIELTKGKVTKIYAKPSTIKGVLTSYSSKSVQIEGYEPLSAEKDLPVYLVASSGHAKIPVRQGKISDLVVGNSKVELVVAEQKACALVSYQEDMAEKVTKALTGAGIWGVEFFLTKEGEVIFSELSPRPHDTGMVTLGHTTNLSEFELHFRAVMGLPIAGIHLEHAGASAVVLSPTETNDPLPYNFMDALKEDYTRVRIFGKEEAHVGRRMGVVLCYGEPTADTTQLRDKAKRLATTVLGTNPYMDK